MSLLSFVRKLVNKLFPIKDIKTALDVKLGVSNDMLDAILLWDRCYKGGADWLHIDGEEDIHSLRIEQAVCSIFADSALSEMDASCENERIQAVLEKTIARLGEEFEKGLATGALIIKPIGDSGAVQFVSQSEFLPVSYDSEKRLRDVIFPDFLKIGNNYYTRLEYHRLTKTGLEITNRAFKSSTQQNLGYEIPLASVEQWADIEPYSFYPGMTRPAFGYYVNPRANTIDSGSKAGISIFERAIDTISDTDRQFARLDYEYDSAERAVHVDDNALKLTKSGVLGLPKRHRRLYRGLNLSGGSEELFREYSPAIRDENYRNGLDSYLRLIEMQCGLAYGDLSNPQSVDKTATEVISAKHRKYESVTAIQKQLAKCLEDYVYAQAFWFGLTAQNPKLQINFEDSILQTDEEKRRQDMQDVAAGLMNPWEYRMKWYGEDKETAKANVPPTAQVMM